MTGPAFEVQQLTRRYGSGARQVCAVDQVDLTIGYGDRLGIVGESGSGKSTLVRLLAALDRPTAGDVLFDGQPIAGRPESRLGFLRSAVQLVFQDPLSSLNPRMRVADIITEPLRSPLLRSQLVRGSQRVPTTRTGREQRLAEVLDQVGLPADSGRRYPHEFSGGQRQRIALARALAPRPRVLIADEPVSALDVSVRSQVINLLNDLVAAEQLTLVFVSHDLTVVRHLCDRVAVMRGGRILEQGATAEVYAQPSDPYTRALLDAIPRLPD